MQPNQYLPVAMMVQSFIASMIYFYTKDFWNGLYWFAGALITYSIVFRGM